MNMMGRQILAFLVAVALGPGLITGQSHAVPTDDFSERCRTLASTDFSGIQDAPTQIDDANLVASTSDGPAYCQVSGYVTPNIGFILRLPPKDWNGKFLEVGCEGACGTTDQVSHCVGPLRRGYACIVSDGGHKGGGLKWALNNLPAQIDQGFRTTHVTALVGKAIVERFYNQAPKQSYFMGCSDGGRQGMMEAQRFPWDFDGIIAGSPSLDPPGIITSIASGYRALTGGTKQSLLAQADLDLLHRAVVEKCDLNDGIKDGLIGDPRACDFDPADLRCSANRKSQCLSAEQIGAVKKIYRGALTSKGDAIYMPGALKGSEQNWLLFLEVHDYVQDWLRYNIFYPSPGPTWKLEDFDFDRDYRRLGIARTLYSAINPDLRNFKSRGGKLLSYAGWNDPVFMALPVVDYYETTERTMGGRSATQDFFRLFVVPGMNHCSFGDGPFAIDYLSYLETWVERGQGPDKLIGFHVKLDDLVDKAMKGDLEAWQTLERRSEFPLDPASVEFSRPIYPYPTQAKYLGHGNPRDAASFGAAALRTTPKQGY